MMHRPSCQLSANVGITIRDRQDPLPESCRLAHVLHGSVQAPMALRQRCQDQIPDAEATQLPFGEAMAQQVPPHGLGIEERAQTLACIPDLWHVQADDAAGRYVHHCRSRPRWQSPRRHTRVAHTGGLPAQCHSPT